MNSRDYILFYNISTKPKKYEIGKLYHLSWAVKGCVWKLKSFDNSGNCIMETPKTKKTIQAKLTDLYHTNSDAIANYKRENKK